MTTCSVEGCERKHYGKGLCSKHYARNRRRNNTRRCSVDGCLRAYVSSGYCGAHYRRYLKSGDVGIAEVQVREKGRVCSVEGCDRPHRSGGYCQGHHARARRGVPLDTPIVAYGVYTECVRDGCRRSPVASGLCSTHYSRFNKYFVKYGITVAEYDALFDMQNGVCFLCEAPLDRDSSRFTHVDHDDATGRCRGILCFRCNIGLGMFHDDPSLMRDAATYLESREDLVARVRD